MPNGESNVVQILQSLTPLGLIGLIGGALDYAYAVQTKKKVWSLVGFLIHLAVSVFAGYLASLAVIGMGYDVTIAGAAAGAAGFLNIRLVDLVLGYIKQKPKE